MKRMKNFLINGFILTITSFFMQMIGMFFRIYISNKIGSEAVGTFGLIMSVYMFAITLATSGIHLAATRITAEQLASDNKFGAKIALRQCLMYSLIVGSISSLLLIIFAPTICTYWLHGLVSNSIFYILSICLPFISMSSALNGYFTGIRKANRNAISQVFEQTFKIILTTYIFSLFLPNGLEYACLALILGETLSEIFSFFFTYMLYIFEVRKISLFRNSLDFKKQILSITLPVAITSYVRSGLSTLKQILIPLRLEKSGMSCEYAISNYGIITGMVMPVLLFPSAIINSFSGLLIPEFSAYRAQGRGNTLSNIMNKIFSITLIFSIGVMGIFFFYSNDISNVFYPETSISEFLKILSPLVCLMYLDIIVDNMLKGLDKQLSVMGVNILDLFVTISSIYFLLPIFGMNGYLIVIFISEILNTSISIIQLKKANPFSISFLKTIFLPIFGISLSCFITTAINIPIITPWLSLICNIFLSIILYCLFLLVFHFFFKK